jgi:3-methyladenine DNA glycosylase Tag
MIERPASDAGYLEAATRIIFMGGLNRQVVDRKWPGFRDAFHDFDPDKVADMTPADVDRLAEDDRVIRYRAKLQAVVENAERMTALAEEHGSFAEYVDELLAEGVEPASRALAKDFAYISEEGARNWLYSTGYDVGPVTDKVKRKYAPYGVDED